jgi:tRNA (mo5U34)-methyltransferase
MIPTISKLKSWLEDAGFSYIKLVDINKTSTKEQRSTPWIGNNSKSLKDFLDQKNQDLTVEGYPAPKRATFICRNL